MFSPFPPPSIAPKAAGLPLLIFLLAVAVSGGLMPTSAWACGPYFDNPKLSWLGAGLLQSPQSHFLSDVTALARTVVVSQRIRAVWKPTQMGDVEDLRAVLGTGPKTDATVAAFLAAREDSTLPLPASIPEEFVRYTEAVRTMQTGDLVAAQAAFASVLDLPADQRRYRSTWAAYMVARMMDEQGTPPTEVASAYGRVVDMVASGATDTIGLAAASQYHASLSHLAAEDWSASIESCLRYRASGGKRGCAALDKRAQSVLEAGPETMRQVMRDSPLAAELIAAWLTSGPHTDWAPQAEVPASELHAWHVRRWLEVAESTGGAIGGANRLGWAAYQAGAFDDARRWVARAATDDPVARWISGKLALRDGDVARAVEELELAAAAMPSPEGVLFTEVPWRTGCAYDSANPVRALLKELGVVLVAADRYEDAMEAFLRAGDWVDAAWVAERLLTTDELKRWVDGMPPVEQYGASLERGQALGVNNELREFAVVPAVSELLARRLMREGRLREAPHYFATGGNRYGARELSAHLQQGRDPSMSETERGEALWAAAKAMKRSGWDLLATELEPDYRSLSGYFLGTDTTARRLDPVGSGSARSPETVAAMKLVAPSAAEQERIVAHAPPIDRRYHFVYTAQDIAWEAVQLLPEGHPQLVEALCLGGIWTRVRDPERADRFWQLLYKKARTTEDGAALLALGWWPKDAGTGTCPVPETTAPDGGMPGCHQGRWGGGAAAGWLAALLGLTWRRRTTVRKQARTR